MDVLSLEQYVREFFGVNRHDHGIQITTGRNLMWIDYKDPPWSCNPRLTMAIGRVLTHEGSLWMTTKQWATHNSVRLDRI